MRSGSSRALAAFAGEQQPHAMGVCDIDDGDALSLATRFALEWAYRGRQALFWRAPFYAEAVRDYYLPARLQQLFDRRGLLIVQARLRGTPCLLAATHLSSERDAYVPQLRFTRRHLRGAGPALFFVDMPAHRTGFAGLGFEPQADGVYARGFASGTLRAASVTV